MISIKYFVKPNRNTLMARIRANGKQLTDLTTGIKLGASRFDYDAGRFPSAEHVLNKKLTEFEAFVHDRHASIVSVYGDNPPADVLSQSLKNTANKSLTVREGNITLSWMIAEYQRLHEEGMMFNAKTGKKLAIATTKTMIETCKLFNKFILAGNDLDFSKYNLGTIPALGKNIVTNQYDTMISSFKAWATSRNLSEYTIFKTVYKLKQMIRFFCEKNSIELGSLLNNLKYKKVMREVEVITPEQIRFIITNYKKLQEDCTTPRQREAVDYLFIGLLLNHRRGDMNNWNADNLYKKPDGSTWIKFKPQKTVNSSGITVDVPVPAQAQAVFAANIIKYGKLLPELSASLNKRLKEIASRYEIFKNEVQIYRKGKYIKVPAWQSIHIHQMRASGISDKLMHMPEATVRELSGHTHDSDAFAKYVNVAQAAKSEQSRKYFETL